MLDKTNSNINSKNPPILISMGEPSGIGAEICLKLVLNKSFSQYIKNQNPALRLVVLGNLSLLKEVAQKFALQVNFIEIKDLKDVPAQSENNLCVLNFDLVEQAELGVLNVKNAPYVLELIKFGALEALAGRAKALVTAPVHKGIINQAGIDFTGHTEYLQNLCGVEKVVMMLTSGKLRVALATTHLPLKDVAAAISAKSLRQVIEILVRDLKNLYGIKQPNIGICGLNPHAGEGGYLGMEELEVINPLIKQMQAEGYSLTQALPADTIFTPQVLQDKDAILAMYHDQGLPTLKYVGWDDGVNITLGLPIIRTSPDHGTAHNIAKQGIASETSLLSAVLEADKAQRSH